MRSDNPTEPYGHDYTTEDEVAEAAADRAADLLAGLRNGAWLDEQVFSPLRYAVPGLVPEGFTLLVGPPKSGKSWLALDVALAVASGGRALGMLPVGPSRPVLLLALEDGDARLQTRCRSLLADDPIPAKLDYLTRIIPSTLLETVNAWLGTHGKACPLVILDTLGRAMPPAAPGESAYGRDYRIGAAVKRLADDHPGTSVLVLHHDRKAGAEDFVDAVSGTHGLAGAADTIVVLSRARGDADGLLQVTGRDVTEAEYAVALGGTGSWRIAGNTLEEASRQAVTRRATAGLGDRSIEVFAEVAKRPNGTTSPSEVAKAIDLDVKQAGVYLRRLADAGRLTKAARGRYRLPTPPVGSVVSVVFGDQADAEDNTPNTNNRGGPGDPGSTS